MADRLAESGALVVEARPPVTMVEQVTLFNALILPAVSPSMPDTIAAVAAGSHREWLRLQSARARVQRLWAEWFADGFDAVLCPVTPTAAFLHNQDGDFRSRTTLINGESRPYADNISWAGLIGVIGLPSAVPPLRRTTEGLPVGVQVVTPYLRDHDAVRLAGLIAEVTGGGYVPPPMALNAI